MLILMIFQLQGFFRGGVAVFPRAFIASVSQLTSFTYTKRYLNKNEYFHDKKILSTFIASMIGGIAISVLVTPFDLILTRLYNQRKSIGIFFINNGNVTSLTIFLQLLIA